MRILILVKSIDGGTGTFVQNFLEINKQFFNDKPKLYVLALEEPSYREYDYKVSFIHSKSHYSQKYWLGLNSVFSFIREYFFIRKTITIFKPQVVLAVDVHCNILVLLYKYFFYPSLKVIASTHIYLSKTLLCKGSTTLHTLLKVLVPFLYSHSDVLIAVSNGVKKDLISYFHIKKEIKVIYNGICIEKRKSGHLKNKNNRILSIGRLVPQKDFITLINAVSCLVPYIPEVKLTIIGDGIQKNELISLVFEMNLQDHIFFRGWKNVNCCDFNDADIFILSSLREGFPYVLLEAMKTGIPVISTDTPYGPKEILLNNKYGIIVPVGNVKSMSIALKTLLKDENKYLHYADKALERVGFFSQDAMLSQYKKIIDEVLAI